MYIFMSFWKEEGNSIMMEEGCHPSYRDVLRFFSYASRSRIYHIANNNRGLVRLCKR